MNRFAGIWMISAVLSAAAFAQVSPDINPFPSRGFGQAKLSLDPQQTISPNLLEGRELNSPTAIAFDTTSSPPIVYIADTGNNRVLAWRNPASLSAGNQADRVIGQRDFFKAFQGGPGSTSGGLTAAGLSLPNALAVDSSGNLWVFDAGNNRILRFSRPLDQPGDLVTPDLVIGQKTVSSGTQSNEGLAKPSEKTLSSNQFGGVARTALAFDADGNLWAADALNHRVLRFPKGRLTGNEPAADLVLGQNAFDSSASTDTQSVITNINRPAALAFDARGGLFVADSLARVLYYDTFVTGSLPRRILGSQPTTAGQVRPPAPNDYTLGQSTGGFVTVQCIATVGNVPYICDTAAHRVVRFGASDAWPAATNTVLSPSILGVYGQNTFFTGGVNRGNGATKPQSDSFATPAGAAVFNNELWVADTGNNRVLALQIVGGSGDLNPATRVVGQPQFDVNSLNLVDGRELFMYDQSFHGASMAIDRSSTPNRLYVADSQNNRILGFADVRKVGTDVRTLLTQPADVIIGQPDRFHTGLNYPSADPLVPTDQGLSRPSGVAVDAQGNLWVADSFNGRLLRFPSPFSVPAGQVQRASVVLGQFNFTSSIPDASSSTMSQPMGIAVFNNGDVAASDYNHNRILIFRKQGADFVNGQTARTVLGQLTFGATASSASATGLNHPRGMAVDTSDRLYVADSFNNRLIVYSSTSTISNGAAGTSIPNLSQPEGVAVSVSTGELWVAEFGANLVSRYPEFTNLGQNPARTAAVQSVAPMAVVLDQFDNLIAAEAVNRMTFYYAQLAYRHAATYASGANINATMTPGMYALAARAGKNFDFTPASGSIPYPKTLGGLQVQVNGVPAPITSITNNVIYFLVPNNAPSSGTAEFLITRPDTGEILAAGTFTMGSAAPGFFTANQQGNRQIAATNEDGTPNSAASPAGQGKLLTLWLTGYGHLDNAPPDGEAAGRAIDTDVKPVIIIGGTYTVPDSKILYSGLSPQFPGLWQINIRMPQNGETGAPAPSNTLPIIVRMRDIPSNIGPTSQLGLDQFMNVPNGQITTLAFK